MSNAGTAAAISKLSATLVGLEESVLAAADCSMMPGGGQDADCTMGNQTLGGGVPMEVVMEIKEQLLMLQKQLLESDPEKMRSLEKENSRLKLQHLELLGQVENARKGLVEGGGKEEELPRDDQEREEFETLKEKEQELRQKLEEQELKFIMEEKARQQKEEEMQKVIQDLESKLEQQLSLVSSASLSLTGCAPAVASGAQINKSLASLDPALHDISCDEIVNFPKSPPRQPPQEVNNSLAFADPGFNLNDISCDDDAASFLCPKSPAALQHRALLVNNSLAMADPRLHETSCDGSILDTVDSATFLCPNPPSSSHQEAESTFTYSSAAPDKFRMSVSRGLVPRSTSTVAPLIDTTVFNEGTPTSPERASSRGEPWQAKLESKVAEVKELEARLAQMQVEVEKKAGLEETLDEVKQKLVAAQEKIESLEVEVADAKGMLEKEEKVESETVEEELADKVMKKQEGELTEENPRLKELEVKLEEAQCESEKLKSNVVKLEVAQCESEKLKS